MTQQQRTIRKAVVGAVYYSFVVAILAAAVLSLTACVMQPTDAVTGQPVGGPVTVGLGGPTHAVPATNPSTGNDVVLKPTGQVDGDQVASDAGTVAGFLPSPYRELVIAGVVGYGAYVTASRKKKSPTQP